MGVALVGLVLVIIGPVRILASRAANGRGGSDGPITAEQALSGLAGEESAALSGNGEALDREFVPFTTIPNRPRNKVIDHIVRTGDTLFGLAAQYSLTPDSIFWANTETLRGNVHQIQNGVDLFILPVDGVYHRSYEDLSIQQIANKYQVEPDVIINSPYNPNLEGLTPNDTPPWGMYVVVPSGIGEYFEIPVLQTVVDEATGQITTAFMPGMAGSCRAGLQGSGGTGGWIPPVAPGGYSFTQPFYPGHSGVDLAAVVGTPVIASDTGMVLYSGWVNADWGYGILVVLDHGNGWTTYYAHLSQTYVSCGQVISRGSPLGAVGSTGNSSGPHVHFEMRWGHNPDNPAFYVGF
jgi:murein DD-endopeptidase MepM/ murein hydrolase activator NlpD